MKNKRIVITVISAFLIIAAAAAALFVVKYVRRPETTEPPEVSIEESSEAPAFVPTALHSVYDQKDKTLTELKEYNPDTVAWITIPGTSCDNVVVLGEDAVRGQNYYLNHSYDHRSTTAGTLYIDYRTTFTPAYLSRNITIYGHHLLDGTMFSQIKKYRDISFYKEHPYFTFETLYGEYDAEVFALYVVDLTTDYGKNFDFRGPDYQSDEQYLAYIDEVKKRSEIVCPVEIGPEDRILTLCTCTYVSNDARLVVAAKLAEKGEGAKIDVSSAYRK